MLLFLSGSFKQGPIDLVPEVVMGLQHPLYFCVLHLIVPGLLKTSFDSR